MRHGPLLEVSFSPSQETDMPQTRPRTQSSQSNTAIKPQFLEFLIQEHVTRTLPRLGMLWDYYRNDLSDSYTNEDRAYQLAQQRGLPARLSHDVVGAGSRVTRRREVVIENDIAWRIHALVDFMFGKPFALQSLAPNTHRAYAIETFLQQVFDANGGVRFFQDLALLGSVYGHVDVLLRTDDVRAIPASLRDALTQHHRNHSDHSTSNKSHESRQPIQRYRHQHS